MAATTNRIAHRKCKEDSCRWSPDAPETVSMQSCCHIRTHCSGVLKTPRTTGGTTVSEMQTALPRLPVLAAGVQQCCTFATSTVSSELWLGRFCRHCVSARGRVRRAVRLWRLQAAAGGCVGTATESEEQFRLMRTANRAVYLFLARSGSLHVTFFLRRSFRSSQRTLAVHQEQAPLSSRVFRPESGRGSVSP